MRVNMRREQRSRSSKTYSISWPDEDGLITREDNSDFTLTLGVDYVESNYSKIPVLNRLLNAGMGSVNSGGCEDVSETPRAAEEMLIGDRPFAILRLYGMASLKFRQL